MWSAAAVSFDSKVSRLIHRTVLFQKYIAKLRAKDEGKTLARSVSYVEELQFKIL